MPAHPHYRNKSLLPSKQSLRSSPYGFRAEPGVFREENSRGDVDQEPGPNGPAGPTDVVPPAKDQADDSKSVGPRDNASDDGDDRSGYGMPPIQTLPIIPGQLLRFVLRPPEGSGAARRKKHPQVRMKKFWDNFEPEYHGGVTRILPEIIVKKSNKKPSSAQIPDQTTTTYQEACDQCIKSVKRIVRECRSQNRKYTDTHFDVEDDLKLKRRGDCLFGLAGNTEDMPLPQDVKRVTEIYEDPVFYKDGASFDDILQGSFAGDCWFLSALSALTASERLVENLCVIRDEKVGVYGFVFHRDGEWQPCIIDDKLYLKAPSFDESVDTVLEKYYVQQNNERKKYKDLFQTGSAALFFAACRDDNETWVPLLEKAFAKAHGDYAALEGGLTGEALEDLTGGITSELYTHNILDKDAFWKDTLSHIGKDYLFSCGTAPWINGRGVMDDDQEEASRRRSGIVTGHAYAVLATYEGFGQRLLKVRNPWGEKEWNGAWSDGSKEWTAEWVERLKHKFGDDGVFWISYEDFLSRYKYIDYTRIFGPEWHIVQQWAQIQVPWNIRDYQQTRFIIEIPKTSDPTVETVIVLSQLDTRYFKGLEGRYRFRLQFRLEKDDDEEDEDEYIIRSKVTYNMGRSTNVTVDLEPGKYVLLFKVEATDCECDDIETVIRKNLDRKNKITQIATLYDLAHAKGRRPEKVKARPKEVEKVASSPTAAEQVSKEDKAEQSLSTEKDKAQAVPTGESSKEEAQASETTPKAEDAATTTAPITDEKKENAGEKAEPIEEKPTGTDGAKKEESGEKATPTDEKLTKADDVKQEPKTPEPSKQDRRLSVSSHGDSEDDEEDPDRNPWNAWCTVGLRIYSKSEDLKITVEYPDDDEDDEPLLLDGDDIAKAALDEAEADAAAATVAATETADKASTEKEEGKQETTTKVKDEAEQSTEQRAAPTKEGQQDEVKTEQK